MTISASLKKDIKNLSNLNGVSSREENISKYIKNSLKGTSFKFEYDNLGSIAVIKKSAKKDAPTIMLAAHMDEIGFMVTKIEKTGYIKFTPIGGWWGHVVLGQKFIITTEKGKEYTGVVGSTPPHIMEYAQTKAVVKIKDMYIDLGASNAKEIEKLGIKPGDIISPDSKMFTMPNGDFVVGKAMDNRAAVAVGIEVMKKLSKVNLDCNVTFVGTTQEEVGLRGARTSAYKWTPDVAFAVDVTIAHDTPGVTPSDVKLGSGVALSLFDSSIIASKPLFNLVEQTAKKSKIPYTYDGLTGGGTDAGAIHLAREGVITMTLSMPSRYIHSHNSMVSLKDMQNTANLLIEFIKGFDNSKLKKLKY